MDSGDCAATVTPTIDSSSSSNSISRSPSSSPPGTPLVVSPCAACKILRRRCADKCVLAPYFPPSDPLKFTIAHRVFGASNLIKFLQEIPESQRADAVSSMVYEANARIRDPVYGCAGAIFQLQKQVNELQAQLAKTQAELLNMQCQQSNLLSIIYTDMGRLAQSPPESPPSSMSSPESGGAAAFPGNGINPSFFIDDTKLGSMWEEPLWT